MGFGVAHPTELTDLSVYEKFRAVLAIVGLEKRGELRRRGMVGRDGEGLSHYWVWGKVWVFARVDLSEGLYFDSLLSFPVCLKLLCSLRLLFRFW